MNSIKIGLWVSCLALMGLIASCGGQNIGSPIQDNPDAPAYDGADNEQIGPLVEFAPPADEDGGDKGASYTPGLPAVIGAGLSFPSVLQYGWKGGLVTEGAAPDWVKLTMAAAGAKPGWNIYGFQEGVAGRLQNIKVVGSGTGMKIELWNWRTGTWNSFGVYNLGVANIPVKVEYAPNGMSYMRLSQTVVGTTRVDKIQTNVF
jgi:hypothetical protein